MSACGSCHKVRRPTGGFTLFELLVVVMIIGLISALVMPRMAASLPGVQLKSAARAMAAALRYARSRAVSESRPYIALFDANQNFVAVEPIETPADADEPDGIRKILEASRLQKVYRFPEGIGFEVLGDRAGAEDPDVFPVLFFPRGDSTGAKIAVQNLRRKRYAITVDTITGTVEIDRL